MEHAMGSLKVPKADWEKYMVELEKEESEI